MTGTLCHGWIIQCKRRAIFPSFSTRIMTRNSFYSTSTHEKMHSSQTLDTASTQLSLSLGIPGLHLDYTIQVFIIYEPTTTATTLRVCVVVIVACGTKYNVYFQDHGRRGSEGERLLTTGATFSTTCHILHPFLCTYSKEEDKETGEE